MDINQGLKCNSDGCHSGDMEVLSQDWRKCDSLIGELHGDWEWCGHSEGQLTAKLWNTYEFEDFANALEFVFKVGAIAEEMNHHPKIELEWGRVRVDLWTHAVSGITELDLGLAKLIDQIK